MWNSQSTVIKGILQNSRYSSFWKHISYAEHIPKAWECSWATRGYATYVIGCFLDPFPGQDANSEKKKSICDKDSGKLF